MIPTLPWVVLVVHAAVSFAMTGIMWLVQIAYYPNLALIGTDDFPKYEQTHVRRVTRPAWAMLWLELLSGLALAFVATRSLLREASYANLALLLVIWCSTWFVQVPLHRRLSDGFDTQAHRRLVRTNWVRTLVYTVRAAGLIVLLCAPSTSQGS